MNLIMGLSQRRIQRLLQEGITSLDELVNLDSQFFLDELNFNSESEVHDLFENIDLFRNKEVYIKEHVSLTPPSQVIYFDIEASPFRGRRLFVVSFASGDGEIVSFVDKEGTNLLKEINTYLGNAENNVLVSSSGSNWDFRHLKTILENRFNHKDNAIRRKSGKDLFILLQKKMISPVGFSVKKFSTYLGYSHLMDVFNDPRVTPYLEKYKRFVKPGKSGYFMGAVYHDKKFAPSFRDAMIEYNVSDVDALRFIYKKVYKLFALKKTGRININASDVL